MDRRQFIKTGGILIVAGTGIGNAVLSAESRVEEANSKGGKRKKWAMAVDISKCRPDCDACITACRKENNTGRFDNPKWDVMRIRKLSVQKKGASSSKSVVVMCNHCDDPPCAQVCPVKATYKREDGIVIVDPHRCMGCRYCMVACPYNARFFNYKTPSERENRAQPKRSDGVAESCDFCAHLIDVGKMPACVNACPSGAMIFGDLNDPDSDISRFVAGANVKRIREDLGCGPNVYYFNL